MNPSSQYGTASEKLGMQGFWFDWFLLCLLPQVSIPMNYLVPHGYSTRFVTLGFFFIFFCPPNDRRDHLHHIHDIQIRDITLIVKVHETTKPTDSKKISQLRGGNKGKANLRGKKTHTHTRRWGDLKSWSCSEMQESWPIELIPVELVFFSFWWVCSLHNGSKFDSGIRSQESNFLWIH